LGNRRLIINSEVRNAPLGGRLPLKPTWHLNAMQLDTKFGMPTLPPFRLRTPAEPMPPPIKEPPSPMENPDAPVREPDPEEPEQI
jgi:hypothetical protein